MNRMSTWDRSYIDVYTPLRGVRLSLSSPTRLIVMFCSSIKTRVSWHANTPCSSIIEKEQTYDAARRPIEYPREKLERTALSGLLALDSLDGSKSVSASIIIKQSCTNTAMLDKLRAVGRALTSADVANRAA